MDSLRIAIVSDLHCKHTSQEGAVKSTLLYSDDILGNNLTNPVKALKDLINKDGLRCDILLCPGDIADKADPQGLSSGWSYLESIQKNIKSNLLVATVGNHDVSVHCAADQDPNAALKILDANYPLPEEELNLQFWQYGFCLVKHEECLIFVFNSCYTHYNPESSRKSRIDDTHIINIQKALDEITISDYKYRIALCHHHPINHGNLSNPDVDLISNGDDLVKLLEKYGFQIIVHGHKHEPRLSYKDSVPVFCAGSLSSTQNVNDLRIENTFHIMELFPNDSKGTIESWVLIPRRGWIKKMDTYFPCLTGFGYRGNLDALAKQCISWLTDKGVQMTDYNLLKNDVKDLAFLTPNDQYLFNKALKANNAQLTPELPNQPSYIGLIYSKND